MSFDLQVPWSSTLGGAITVGDGWRVRVCVSVSVCVCVCMCVCVCVCVLQFHLGRCRMEFLVTGAMSFYLQVPWASTLAGAMSFYLQVPWASTLGSAISVGDGWPSLPHRSSSMVASSIELDGGTPGLSSWAASPN
jgi:hypothetical protein